MWKSTDSNKKEEPRFLRCCDIQDVLIGADRTTVTKKHKIARELDSLCFSVVAKDRTLDLQAEDTQSVDLWYEKFCRLYVRETRLSVAKRIGIEAVEPPA